MLLYEKVAEAREFIKKQTDIKPDIAVILGSGLGSFADKIEDAQIIPFGDIPYWPHSTAPGHAGKLILGHFMGHDIAVMQGRVHYYEGYSMDEVTFPVRVLGELDVRVMLATNASGGISEGYAKVAPGTIVGVYDHINYMGVNPLIGENNSKWGERFPDMTTAYDLEFLDLFESIAKKESINFSRGVYIAFTGPSYETPAEIRMARIMGANVVGMSTVPEVIVANHMGLRVAVLSCVANYAAGRLDKKINEKEVLTEMSKISANLNILISDFIKQVKF